MKAKALDRSGEDLGNIVNLGHVNVQVADQRLATAFYVTGLGLTRDPYLMTGTNNMWVNVGMSQFHLPTRKPQVVQGITGLVIPGRDALLERLGAVKPELKGTRFKYRATNDAVEVTCPWGNRIDVHAPDPERFGRTGLGMAYVEFDVPKGAAEGIGRFYREVFLATVDMIEWKGAPCARVSAGEDQYLYFRETRKPRVPYDNNHIQFYITNFSAPYKRLFEMGLIYQESGPHQYRFKDIKDPKTGKVVYVIDHEVRSMRHPMYARPLVNRNTAIGLRAYDPGAEGTHWTTG
jgi:predicted enzyme related to lactoylglutathione lyase